MQHDHDHDHVHNHEHGHGSHPVQSDSDAADPQIALMEQPLRELLVPKRILQPMGESSPAQSNGWSPSTVRPRQEGVALRLWTDRITSSLPRGRAAPRSCGVRLQVSAFRSSRRPGFATGPQCDRVHALPRATRGLARAAAELVQEQGVPFPRGTRYRAWF